MSVAALAIDAYHRALERRSAEAPSLLADLLAAEEAHRLSYGGKPIPTFLRPAFLDLEQVALVRRVVGTLADALERVLRDYLEHPEVRRSIPFEEGTADLLALATGLRRNVIVARFDSFLGPDYLLFNEFNTDSPASMAWNEVQQALFTRLPMMGTVGAEFELQSEASGAALVDALLGAFEDFGRAEAPTVLITDWADVSTREEFEVVRERFEALGIPCAIADPREIEFRRGRAWGGGVGANLIYRRVVWSELLPKLDECAGLLEALRSDTVCVANPLAAKIAGNKACLAWLSDEANRDRFTPEQWETIRAHVPWTAVLRHGLVRYRGRPTDPFDLAAGAREAFVIKPLNDYGGRGVMLGDQVEGAEWEARLAQVEEEPDRWCLQERIPIPAQPFPVVAGTLAFEPFNVNLNPYVLGGRYGGSLTRLSRSPIINVSAGGGMVPTFIVTGRRPPQEGS
jgi:hypothetical protein